MNIIGLKCFIRRSGMDWALGVIQKHNVKKGVCLVATERHGKLKVDVTAIRLFREEDYI